MGIKDYLKKLKRIKEVKDWIKQGKNPPTPQLIKQSVVRSYGETYKIDTLIETGTYTGDMVEAVKPYFKEIYSVELSEVLYAKCKKRFQGKANSNIFLFCGDSANELKKMLAISSESQPEKLRDVTQVRISDKFAMDEPQNSRKLFWLDAHYSGGETAHVALNTPIVKEIDIVLKDNPKHIILIDDARLFNGTNDYPTLEVIKNYVSTFGKTIKVEDDIIKIY